MTWYLNDKKKEEGGISRADYFLEYKSPPLTFIRGRCLHPLTCFSMLVASLVFFPLDCILTDLTDLVPSH